MYGLIMLEFCDANPAAGLQEKIQEEFPDITVLENTCMSQCQLCDESWYAMLDGEVVYGNDECDFIDKLRIAIQQHKSAYDTFTSTE